jgi:hypothetical protein
MRSSILAVTSVAALLTAAGTAWSADLPTRPYATRHAAFGVRTGAIVVYDYEPGVAVRAYWIAPWRNRRYFPTDSEVPEIGRDEDLADRGDMPQPAEAFERSWSTSAAFKRERPRLRVIDDEEGAPLPDPTKPLK